MIECHELLCKLAKPKGLGDGPNTIAEAFLIPTCTTIIADAAQASDTITLDRDARHRRRVRMVSDGGTPFLLNLPNARLLRDGDGLALDDGSVVRVVAQAERLLEIRGQDARHLNALAWQIGNRHLAAQIEADRIVIESDRVIADMLSGLGAEVRDVKEPFHPEGGAYGDHSHPHDHSHSPAHSQATSDGHSHRHGHDG